MCPFRVILFGAAPLCVKGGEALKSIGTQPSPDTGLHRNPPEVVNVKWMILGKVVINPGY